MSDRNHHVTKRRLERQKRYQALQHANGVARSRAHASIFDGRSLLGPLALGVVVGVATGAVTAAKVDSNHGDAISGDVRVHLLNKIELVTIKLQLQRSRV
jgi:hypothetical protein